MPFESYEAGGATGTTASSCCATELPAEFQPPTEPAEDGTTPRETSSSTHVCVCLSPIWPAVQLGLLCTSPINKCYKYKEKDVEA